MSSFGNVTNRQDDVISIKCLLSRRLCARNLPPGADPPVGRMDTVHVTTPTGRVLRVRLSALKGVETTNDTWFGRRYYIRYKTGRRVQVVRDSADMVFDALSPKLFDKM